MKKFEYKLHKVGPVPMSDDPKDRTYAETQEKFLNTLGDEGWELVMHGSEHLVFKRVLSFRARCSKMFGLARFRISRWLWWVSTR